MNDWLQARQQGLSSSDLAAILGRSEHRSPWMVARQKLGLEGEKAVERTEDMYWGDAMEPLVATAWANRKGANLFEPHGVDAPAGIACTFLDGARRRAMYFNRDAPILRSTPDYLATLGGRLGIVEVKTTGQWARWDDGIPKATWLQCQWHMLCSGLAVCWLPVLLFGKRRVLRAYELELDPAFAGADSKAGRFALDWWDKHIVRGLPVTPCHLDIPYLTRTHPAGDGKTVVLSAAQATLDTQFVETAATLTTARKAHKAASQAHRSVQAQLRLAIADATFAEFAGGTAVLYSLTSGPLGKGRVLRRKAR